MTRIMVCISLEFVIYVSYRSCFVRATAPTGESALRQRRAELRTEGVLKVAELAAQPSCQIVKAASMVVVCQALPTAKGHLFSTLEDQAGPVNLIIRPDLNERERAALHNAVLLRVEGRLQWGGAAVSL
jgi:error-prone DNA polymerase